MSFILLLVIPLPIFAQNNLEYFLEKGMQNSPTLKEYKNLQAVSSLQEKLDEAQNSGFNIFLSSDYLFSPYFNNNGNLLSTNPDPKAIGYDVGITNGGLYSAQLNIEKNIFNSPVIDALQEKNNIQNQQYQYNYMAEKHNLKKEITEIYLSAYESMLINKLAEESAENLEQQVQIISELVEKGYEKVQNFLLMKIELKNRQNSVKESSRKYENDLMNLKIFCGVTDTNNYALLPVQLSVESELESSNFLKKYEFDSLNVSSSQTVFESKYSPQLKVFANTGLNALEIEGIQRKFGFSAGFSFSLPLYDGGQKDIARQQNTINENIIQDYKNYANDKLQVQRNNALANINTIKESLKTIESQLEDYNTIIRISDQQLKTGDISVVDYLSILQNFIDLKKTKIEKEITYELEINNYNYWNW